MYQYFPVNAGDGEERKNSGSPLLGGQFELFTSSVEPTNECGICQSVRVVPTQSHKSGQFFLIPDQYLYLFFTNYSCTPPLLFPILFPSRSRSFSFFFLRGTFALFPRINMRKPQFFSPTDTKKKSTTNLLCRKQKKTNTKTKGGGRGIKAGYYVEPDIITL